MKADFDGGHFLEQFDYKLTYGFNFEHTFVDRVFICLLLLKVVPLHQFLAQIILFW